MRPDQIIHPATPVPLTASRTRASTRNRRPRFTRALCHLLVSTRIGTTAQRQRASASAAPSPPWRTAHRRVILRE